MSTDASMIYNTFHNDGKQPDQFASADWAYLADSYNGNNTNSTQFLTTPLKTQFIDYHNAYVTIPMALTSSVGAYCDVLFGGFEFVCAIVSDC